MVFLTRAVACSTAGFKRFIYNMQGHNKYGLFRDDTLFETPEVEEAVRRLPQSVQDERNFRMIRAMQLSLEYKIFPEKDWLKIEDDIPYLQPYLEEVKKEKKEKEDWERDHP